MVDFNQVKVLMIKDINFICFIKVLYKNECTSSHLIAGNLPTDENDLKNMMAQPNIVVLKYINEQDEVIASINLYKFCN